MLIFATIAINVAGVAIWSAVYGANGFKEIGKLIRGEPAFIPPANKGDNDDELDEARRQGGGTGPVPDDDKDDDHRFGKA